MDTAALVSADRVPPTTRLTGIEAGRGVAASVVVLYHVARHLNRAAPAPLMASLFHFGHSGVDFFFVISGFIILHVHAADIGRPSRLRHYGARRLTRVVPAYWVALALTIAMSASGGRHGLPGAGEFVWSLLLLPSNTPPLLGVAWTLQYEVVFYAVFAVLIANRAAGAALLVLWLGWIVFSLAGDGSGVVPRSLYGVYNLEFFAGMGAAYLLATTRIAAPLGVLALGVILFACAAAAEDFGLLHGYGNYARLAYGLPSAAIVLGAATSDREGRLAVPAWLRVLGGASYSIYLFQFGFIGLGWQVLSRTGAYEKMPIWASFLVLAGLGVGGGVLMSRRVEYPLMRRLRVMGRRRALPLEPVVPSTHSRDEA
jgi:exopolysaccharide production protein ExoZ